MHLNYIIFSPYTFRNLETNMHPSLLKKHFKLKWVDIVPPLPSTPLGLFGDQSTINIQILFWFHNFGLRISCLPFSGEHRSDDIYGFFTDVNICVNKTWTGPEIG
ncbi:hypothetical protein CHS0354_042462 [Potamilus streckersoni]|uniref:Uncharacterized protein n=1 Tax=Potamilus streckersoni TaxID=2493646 RepID=A0AAE0S9U9_9BIVA|nr:hypothetical protein CHS0354_042462 [Potamilus streckersoni]